MKPIAQLINATLLLMILALPTLAAAADGATLFTTSCARCHTRSSLSGETAAGIRSALSEESIHSSFRSSLTAADYTALAAYLAGTTTTAISISTASLASGTVGKVYSQTLAATGGKSPYTWTVSSGTLPAGLRLSSGGTISGTPTAAKSASVTFRVTDSAATRGTATRTLSITISSATTSDGATLFTTSCARCHTRSSLSGETAAGIRSALSEESIHSSFRSSLTAADYTALAAYLAGTTTTAISISTASLASGTVGTAYSQALSATGGTTPYTWSVASGTLPAGLSLSSAGVISGTPTAAATASVTFRVTDSATTRATVTKALTITVLSAATSDGATLFSAKCASCHTASKMSGRTVAQIQTSLSSVSRHSGITLTVADIQALSTYLGGSATTPTLLTITTATLPVAVVSGTYSQSLTASGGTAPYTWSSTGTLPPGLGLYTSGALSGTPTTLGTWVFTVRVADAAAASATRTLSVTVAASAPLAITSAALAAATVDTPYTDALVASGGTSPYTWKATGILPPGLSVTSAGSITGTPTSGGTYTVIATVTDAAAATATAPVSLAVTSAPVVFPTGKPAKYGSCASCHASTPYTIPPAGQWTPGGD